MAKPKYERIPIHSAKNAITLNKQILKNLERIL